MTAHSTTSLDRAALQRRSLRVLAFAQVLSGAGLAAGVTVGALLAEDMLGSTRLSGLPAALLTLGSAAAALLVGRISQRVGRRPGLALGYATGAVGGAGVTFAAVLDNPALLLLSLFVYGSGTATNLQARYAGADLAEPARRGAAISTVLVATTVGAVAGPNLVPLTGRIATAVGIPALAGPFVLAAIAYALAAVALTALLRPDPLLTARTIAEHDAAQTPLADAPAGGAPAPPGSDDVRGLRLGATAMVLTQIVMVSVMTMTPVHMRDHGHGLGATGLVIAVHIAGMYLPSPVSGRLADRYGSRPVLAAGAVSLLAAGVIAAIAPARSIALLAVALGLLGLGWNLGLLGGTTLVTSAVSVAGRARTQGKVDLAIAMSGATGGLASGIVVASTSYAALAIAGAIVAVTILPATLSPTALERTRAYALRPPRA